jgi:hypothetical protein
VIVVGTVTSAAVPKKRLIEMHRESRMECPQILKKRFPPAIEICARFVPARAKASKCRNPDGSHSDKSDEQFQKTNLSRHQSFESDSKVTADSDEH